MATSPDEATANYERVVARAHTDPDFRKRLLEDPHAALADAGAEIQPGISVKVVENTDDTVHLVLPSATSGDEVDLNGVSGGTAGIGFAIGAYIKFKAH